MQVEPYDDGVACAGPSAPECEQIDDLIRLLVTISHRWGNTAVKYRVSWGGSALWAEDEARGLLRRWLKLIREPSSEDVHLLEKQTAEYIGEASEGDAKGE